MKRGHGRSPHGTGKSGYAAVSLGENLMGPGERNLKVFPGASIPFQQKGNKESYPA